ncbi:unnamed protein product [Hymenolepis diminuta]|uniref:DDE_Tnp_1_7 domain-containing protein n=1 Tax=Hymenolepis diminuta TaxID=6216 RepID=A0A0R3SAT9_HYMDI|nr:unnamed protein product [Hymenolepis diminuta]
MIGGYVLADLTEVPTVMHANEAFSNGPMESMEEDPMSSNKIRLRPIKLSKPRIGWIAENFHHQVDKHFHSTKPSPMEAIAGAMEDMNKDHLIKAWDGFRS